MGMNVDGEWIFQMELMKRIVAIREISSKWKRYFIKFSSKVVETSFFKVTQQPSPIIRPAELQ
jgi:hypothetical protein